VHFGEADAHRRRIRRIASADFWQLRGQWRLFRDWGGLLVMGRAAFQPIGVWSGGCSAEADLRPD